MLNVMKQLYTYLLLLATLGSTSCSESWLDLDPSTSVETPKAIQTLEDAQSALNGIYRLASAHSYYGDNYLYYGDCRAEDVQARESLGAGHRVSPYYEYNVTASDNFNITLVWNQAYKVIRQTNSLLYYINQGNIQTDDSQSLERIKSETLAMRGLALYDLTRLFGMPYTYDNGASLGVPIETTLTDQSHQPGRNTVAECYKQVIEDLSNSLNGLSKDKTDGYLNYWAVQGLLSRVYLNKGDYEAAYTAATDVIENSKQLYQLYTYEEYPNVWGKDFQSESLFEFYFSLTEPSGGSGGEGAPMVYANETKAEWNNLILTKAYLDLLNEDPNDIRHCLTQASVIANHEGLPEAARKEKVYLTKYPGKSGDPRDNNLCIVRLSEIYLNAAEAGWQLKGEKATKGREYLNEIVSRRTQPSQTVEEGEFTLERILKERRKELVGEGLALYDYTRNKLTVNREGGWHLSTIKDGQADHIAYNDLRLALPIPQAEIDANPNMKQNPR